MKRDAKFDLREAPAYRLSEAAHYLALSPSTVRAWTVAQRGFKPVIAIADPRTKTLSFVNLVEAHVLAAIRRKHGVTLQSVRRALDYTRTRLEVERPLAHQQFETNGVDLFVEKLGSTINVSRSGQLAMAKELRAHLERIERDPKGVPIKLYPFTRAPEAGREMRSIVIDPRVSFGRPILVHTGVPTAVLADRYKAGDSIDALAQDFGASRDEIEEAIRCELALQAA